MIREGIIRNNLFSIMNEYLGNSNDPNEELKFIIPFEAITFISASSKDVIDKKLKKDKKLTFLEINEDEKSMFELANIVKKVKRNQSKLDSLNYIAKLDYKFNFKYKEMFNYLITVYAKESNVFDVIIRDFDTKEVLDAVKFLSKQKSSISVTYDRADINRCAALFNKKGSGFISEENKFLNDDSEKSYFLRDNENKDNLIMTESVLNKLFEITKLSNSKMAVRKEILNQVFFDYKNYKDNRIIQVDFYDEINFNEEGITSQYMTIYEYRLILQLVATVKLIRLSFVPQNQRRLLKAPHNQYLSLSLNINAEPKNIGRIKTNTIKFLSKEQISEIISIIEELRAFFLLESVYHAVNNPAISATMSKAFDLIEKIQYNGEN